MHYTQLPRVGDEVTGVIVGTDGAVSHYNEDSDAEETFARFVVELREPLSDVDEQPQEPAGGVEPHAGEPEPKITSNETPNRDAKIAAEKKASSARAAQAVKSQQTHADQSEVNEAGDKAAKAAGAKADGNPKTSTDKK